MKTNFLAGIALSSMCSQHPRAQAKLSLTAIPCLNDGPIARADQGRFVDRFESLRTRSLPTMPAGKK